MRLELGATRLSAGASDVRHLVKVIATMTIVVAAMGAPREERNGRDGPDLDPRSFLHQN
jgi:hypothetical protein